MLKVTLLIDDQESEQFKTEHGLSIFLEKDNLKFIFDTGQSSRFLDNAKKLDIDLEDLDGVVISHGHYDHANGLEYLLKEFTPKKVFLGKGFFETKYKVLPSGELLLRSTPYGENIFNHTKIDYITETKTEIFKDVYIIRNFKRVTDYEKDNPIFLLKDNGGYKIDNFNDEISLVVRVEGKLNVFIGCAHPGVVNMLKTIKENFTDKIGMVYGGIHLKDASEYKINKTLDDLRDLQIPFFHLLHCTGSVATKKIAQKKNLNNRNIKVGETIFI